MHVLSFRNHCPYGAVVGECKSIVPTNVGLAAAWLMMIIIINSMPWKQAAGCLEMS